MNLISWRDLAASEAKEIPFLIDPYIPKESLILLYGNTSIGKSPLTWEMAKSIGSGEHFFGLPVEKGKVLYLETDTPEIVVAPRIQKIPSPPEGVWFLFSKPLSAPLLDKEILDGLCSAYEEVLPDVVFINSLRKIHDEDDKDSKTPKIVYSFFQKLFPGAALVFTHHIRKSPIDPRIQENDSEAFSGSKHWLDDAQVGLHLSKFHRREGKSVENLRLYHIKSQVSETIAPLPLKLHGDGSTLTSPRYDELFRIYELLNADQLPVGEVDKLIGEEFGLSLSTAKRRRAMIEDHKFPGSRHFLDLEHGQGSEDKE